MNKDEIIRMAREANVLGIEPVPRLEHFAALVAEAEREACAKLFDQPYVEHFGQEVADTIRARGEQA